MLLLLLSWLVVGVSNVIVIVLLASNVIVIVLLARSRCIICYSYCSLGS